MLLFLTFIYQGEPGFMVKIRIEGIGLCGAGIFSDIKGIAIGQQKPVDAFASDDKDFRGILGEQLKKLLFAIYIDKLCIR